MMVLTQEGALQLWKYLLGIVGASPPYVHLFGSSHTPQHTDFEATYGAIELVVAGYAPIQLVNPGANWTLGATAYGAQAQYITITWVFTAACTVYGYWLSAGPGTVSLWGEAFTGPYSYGAGGGSFSLILPPTLISCPFPEPLCQ